LDYADITKEQLIAEADELRRRIAELEEQYRQAQKMEVMGQLTASIAHDFNNLLTVVNGFAGLLQARLPIGDPAHELAGKILVAGRRGNDLVRQLLEFSRKQVTRPQVTNLNHVVAEMDTILRRIIGEQVELTTTLAPDVWSVKIDQGQIEQTIINLAVNARDAMPDGGRLTIKTANVVLEEDYMGCHLETRPPEHVLLAISDTGTGMTPEVKAHLFEPFFTTKGPGQGTGLGLATVYGIVKQAGGSVWVHSEEGKGATFEIYLPRVQETALPLSQSEPTERVQGGNETILLVEDDASVRDLTHLVLQEHGYTVLAAANGHDALQLAATHCGPINLLLSDMMLPGINAVTLDNRLRRLRPDLKTLYMSGYTVEALARYGAVDSGFTYLQKPFSVVQLVREVRAALDGTAGHSIWTDAAARAGPALYHAEGMSRVH
jgi:two-component system cell cycle sensor histidine kinase/response regulator CckA